MKALRSLPSLVASGLVLAFASAARADESAPDDVFLGPPEVHPARVRVHVKSPSPVQLEARESGAAAWAPVCGVPCDQELPLGDEYRIVYGKNGDAPGLPFRLTATGPGGVVLKVHPASLGAKAGGGVLIGLGAALATVGALGLFVGIAVAAQPTECRADAGDWCSSGPALGEAVALVSLVPLLVGGGIIAGGASMMAGSKASATQRPASGREPTWVGPRAAGASGRAGFVAPLSFSF
jgi:hypothetical protein